MMRDAEPEKPTYASTTGKSVECALEYFPMDVQFALGSKISQLIHTFTEQYKAQQLKFNMPNDT